MADSQIFGYRFNSGLPLWRLNHLLRGQGLPGVEKALQWALDIAYFVNGCCGCFGHGGALYYLDFYLLGSGDQPGLYG